MASSNFYNCCSDEVVGQREPHEEAFNSLKGSGSKLGSYMSDNGRRLREVLSDDGSAVKDRLSSGDETPTVSPYSNHDATGEEVIIGSHSVPAHPNTRNRKRAQPAKSNQPEGFSLLNYLCSPNTEPAIADELVLGRESDPPSPKPFDASPPSPKHFDTSPEEGNRKRKQKHGDKLQRKSVKSTQTGGNGRRSYHQPLHVPISKQSAPLGRAFKKLGSDIANGLAEMIPGVTPSGRKSESRRKSGMIAGRKSGVSRGARKSAVTGRDSIGDEDKLRKKRYSEKKIKEHTKTAQSFEKKLSGRSGKKKEAPMPFEMFFGPTRSQPTEKKARTGVQTPSPRHGKTSRHGEIMTENEKEEFKFTKSKTEKTQIRPERAFSRAETMSPKKKDKKKKDKKNPGHGGALAALFSNAAPVIESPTAKAMLQTGVFFPASPKSAARGSPKNKREKKDTDDLFNLKSPMSNARDTDDDEGDEDKNRLLMFRQTDTADGVSSTNPPARKGSEGLRSMKKGDLN